MWAHDYCTVCDKQCAPGSMYCSDACRASELVMSQEVSSSTTNVYSTLYTTCRHHSITSPLPACENPQCSNTHCVCDLAAADMFDSYPSTPELSPALTASSSPISIRSDKFHSGMPSSKTMLSPPPSPLMIPSGYFNSTKKEQTEFTSTSNNYRRWLSAA